MVFKINAISRLLLDNDEIKERGFKGPLEESSDWWSHSAAGALILARASGRILLQLRAEDDGDAPNVWGQFGGGIDSNETPERAIKREIKEETGLDGGDQWGNDQHDNKSYTLHPLMTYRSLELVYYNYLAIVDQEYEPQIDHESQAGEWFELDGLPQPLHPGLIELLNDGPSYRLIRDEVLKAKAGITSIG